MQTPWAILLTKFSDNDAEPYSRSRYEEIFTSSGSGKWNMVDYFNEMSHGKLDLSGSKIFGWYTLDQTESEYTGSGANQKGRQDLINWARQKAIENEVHLNKFFNVVVVLNNGLDLFGGGNGVVCGDDGQNIFISGLSPSLLGQEMGHGYGMSHSRRAGSTDPYGDPFDIMSTMSALMAAHPLHMERQIRDGSPIFRIGPGLNAANMDAMGWLDETRVYNIAGSNAYSNIVQLRPLHRHDLPGYLAIRFSGFVIEFRMNERWDAAFGDPAVLIHNYDGGYSYIVSDSGGSLAFGIGSSLSTPESLSIFGSGIAISIQNIDPIKRIATVHLVRTPAQIPREWPIQGPFDTPWVKWNEVDEALVIVKGQSIRIRKQSPTYDILEQIFLFESSIGMKSQGLRTAMQEETLSQITKQVKLLENERFKSPRIFGNQG